MSSASIDADLEEELAFCFRGFGKLGTSSASRGCHFCLEALRFIIALHD
jgi:hypothetical protein